MIPVDDNPVVAIALRHYLVAETNRNVVKEVRSGRIDGGDVAGAVRNALLVDLRMPLTDAADATCKIATRYPVVTVLVATTSLNRRAAPSELTPFGICGKHLRPHSEDIRGRGRVITGGLQLPQKSAGGLWNDVEQER